jgi:mono/diheme cytochrome c family protein
MVFALSTGHEIGLAGTGAAFITFALLSSFVFPRMDPDFPGKKGMRWYIPLAVCFFLAMMAAVIVFGREKKTPVAQAAPPAASAPSSGGKLTSGPYANGDATVGKTVFTGVGGCGACHTLTAAATTGKIGPNLDQIASYAQKAHEGLEQFIASAITKPPAPYVPPGFPTNVMPTTFAQSLTAKDIAGLVAFVAASAKG